jgi:hypothetical protein
MITYTENKTVFENKEEDFLLVFQKATETKLATIDMHLGNKYYTFGVDKDGNLKDLFDLPKIND